MKLNIFSWIGSIFRRRKGFTSESTANSSSTQAKGTLTGISVSRSLSSKSISDQNRNNAVTDTKSKNDFNIKQVSRAKDIIPEYLGKAPTIDQAKKFNNNGAFIGQGSYGTVQHTRAKAINKEQNMSGFFVKKKYIDKDRVSAKDLAKIAHSKNQKFGIASRLQKKDVITEYKGETLASLFKANKIDVENIEKPYKSQKMSIEDKINLSKQILQATQKIHAQGAVHQDIKPDNILVAANGKVSIIDYDGMQYPDSTQGSSGVVPTGLTSKSITPPELQQDNKWVNDKYDSWGVGLVIYELFIGEHLLKGLTNTTSLYWDEERINIVNRNFSNNITNNKNIPTDVKELLSSLLAKNAENRISVQDALQLDIFKQRTSLVRYSVKHDEAFKKLAKLEDELEKISITDIENYNSLENKIAQKRDLIKKLQHKINKFN